MEILIVHKSLSQETLNELAEAWHQTLVKGVADVMLGKIALGGEWHMDANNRLLLEGCNQQNLWGFNLYPKEKGDAAIEYNSLINIRPTQGNFGMEISDEGIKKAVRKIVAPIVPSLEL